MAAQVLNLYQIVKVEGRKKPLWNRAGIGFVNSDGSINLTVDSLPGCRFQLRLPNPKPEEKKAKTRKR
ncbi:MAG: hypothetical protein AB1757_06750 [Acidobacteriota bacterium]